MSKYCFILNIRVVYYIVNFPRTVFSGKILQLNGKGNIFIRNSNFTGDSGLRRDKKNLFWFSVRCSLFEIIEKDNM